MQGEGEMVAALAAATLFRRRWRRRRWVAPTVTDYVPANRAERRRLARLFPAPASPGVPTNTDREGA